MEHRFVILLHAQDALTKAASRLQRIRARTHTRRNRGNNEVLSTCKAHRFEIIWRQIISLGVPNLQRSGPARACPMQPFRFFSWSECIFFPLQLFQSCKANCHETLMKVSQEHIHPTDFFKSLVSILMHPKVFLAGPIASVASAAPGTTEDPRNWTVEPFQISWCVWASLKIGHPPYPALFHNFPPIKVALGAISPFSERFISTTGTTWCRLSQLLRLFNFSPRLAGFMWFSHQLDFNDFQFILDMHWSLDRNTNH